MGPHLRSKTHGIAPTDPRYADLCAAAVVYEGGHVRRQAANKQRERRAAIIDENRKKVDLFFEQEYKSSDSSLDGSYTPSMESEECGSAECGSRAQDVLIENDEIRQGNDSSIAKVQDEESHSSVYSVDCEKDSDTSSLESIGSEEVDDLIEHSNNRQTEAILTQYYEWLTSPDAGNKDARASKQSQDQLRRIIGCIDESMDISALMNATDIKVSFLQGYCVRRGYKAGTIKSYVISLKNFMSFLIAERHPVFDMGHVLSMEKRITNWMKTYQKEQAKTRYQKDEHELETEITPEMISKFEVSAVCREAVKQLEVIRQGQGSTSVSQQMFTNVRDFLITQISINNAHRSGVMANLLLDEFYKATLKDNYYIIRVMKHKTCGTHGAARIIINERLFELIETYVKFVRSKVLLKAKAERYMFVSWCGGHLSSSGISGAINAIWKKSGKFISYLALFV